MLKNDNNTSIMTLGATASLRGSAKFASFAAAKFAMRAVTQSIAREFHPKGIHAVNFILDGMMIADKEKIEKGENENKMNPHDIADTYYFVHTQPKSCWTQEIDLRTNVEKF